MNHLIVALFCVGLATIAMGKFENGFCDTEYGKFDIGEEWGTEFPCSRNTCMGNGSIGGTDCGVIYAPKCKIVPGKGRYPDCCDKYVCPSDES